MNWYKIAQTHRGRWGDMQSDEYRSHQDATQERYQDYEVISGEHIKTLHEFFRQGRFSDFDNYVQKLKDEGFSQRNIDAMIGSATRGKVPSIIS